MRLSATGVAGAWLSGCGDATGPSLSPGQLGGGSRPKRIVVVGAGVSGLVAAYELRAAGHNVSVVEARNRIGGRVLTIREPFSAAHSAEAGAARIPPHHDLTLGYAAHFGLELSEFYPRDGLYVDRTSGTTALQSADAFRAQRPAYRKIVGGSDRLTGAFAAALASTITVGDPVESITRDTTGVRVTTRAGTTLDADRVLVTVPIPVLDRIDFTPSLSAGKNEAAAGGFGYQAATRIFLRTRSRFWEASDLNGWGVSHWPEEIWHPTWDAPGPEGVLLTYVRGDRARGLDALAEEDRVEALLDHWESIFPGIRSETLDGVTHSWQDEEWSRGSWAAPTAAEDAALGAQIAAAEDRLHFCGEHASGARGWIQGALESGLRAAREIHEA